MEIAFPLELEVGALEACGPDICFAVNTLSQFLTDPRHVHLMVTKHAVRYLKGTVDYGLKYEVNQNINLEGYVDSDWVGSAIDRKSNSSMRSGVISWFSRKESCMALSTVKEKYIQSFLATWERGAVKIQFVIQIEIS